MCQSLIDDPSVIAGRWPNSALIRLPIIHHFAATDDAEGLVTGSPTWSNLLAHKLSVFILSLSDISFDFFFFWFLFFFFTVSHTFTPARRVQSATGHRQVLNNIRPRSALILLLRCFIFSWCGARHVTSAFLVLMRVNHRRWTQAYTLPYVHVTCQRQSDLRRTLQRKKLRNLLVKHADTSVHVHKTRSQSARWRKKKKKCQKKVVGVEWKKKNFFFFFFISTVLVCCIGFACASQSASLHDKVLQNMFQCFFYFCKSESSNKAATLNLLGNWADGWGKKRGGGCR